MANQWVTIWLEALGTLTVLGCGVLTVWITSTDAPSLLAGHVDAGKMGLLMSYAVLVPTNLGWLLKVRTATLTRSQHNRTISRGSTKRVEPYP